MRGLEGLTGRTLGDLRAVVSGAGAAGIAVANMLLAAGIGDIAVCDRGGVMTPDRDDLGPVKRDMAMRMAGMMSLLENGLTT